MSNAEGQSNVSLSGYSGDTTASGIPALVLLDLGSLREFDTKGNSNGISQRWKKCKRAFNLYLVGRSYSRFIVTSAFVTCG